MLYHGDWPYQMGPGKVLSWSFRYWAMPALIWRRFETHCGLSPEERAFAKTGNSRAARIAMILMTTSSSRTQYPAARLIKEAGDVPLALAAQAPLTDTATRGLARLTLYVSHFHQVYDLGVARGSFTAGGRAYYGREIAAD